MTAVGARWYVFYTGDAELAAELSGPLREALGDGAVSVTGEPDGDWQAYSRLLKDARSKFLGWAVLCAIPFVCGALSLRAYGPPWALADMAVLVLVGAVGFRSRKHAQWYLAHPVLMFGGYALLMAALLFAVCAMVEPPAWASLSISLVAGTAVTALVWKAQLRYWQEQVPVGTGP